MECKTAVKLSFYICSYYTEQKVYMPLKHNDFSHLNNYSPDNLKSILGSVNQMKNFTFSS